ncbi:MAG: tRNA threonylcarbamoyladenosine biosynthesis protein TsaE [Patescibacteria group bacterium]|nr:tRNA threonylcarbamoyladenosine biosynthesis protein TsaE [Patescibacteria group bacterium]
MLEEKRYFSETAEETRLLGRDFGNTLSPGTLICFRGDLGAGKTTFIQGMLAVLGARPPFVSPTFILMKEYDLDTPTANGIRRVYHADAYRMERAEDFEKIGFTEWCADPEGIVLLEWPERIEALLSNTRIDITLSLKTGSDTHREIRIDKK